MYVCIGRPQGNDAGVAERAGVVAKMTVCTQSKTKDNRKIWKL